MRPPPPPKHAAVAESYSQLMQRFIQQSQSKKAALGKRGIDASSGPSRGGPGEKKVKFTH